MGTPTQISAPRCADQIAAAWMRDQIAASVSSTAEQVHVKQILLYNEGEAQQALGLLQAGRHFE